MKRILLTGLSGVGKTSVIQTLRARGFHAIDTDYDDWCELADGERIWREDKMRELLTAPLTSPLFISGCYSNQGKFAEFFDAKILLGAPLEEMLRRVANRDSNPYGKSESHREEIRWNFEYIQPLLKQGADFELDSATMCVQEIADFLVNLAQKEKAHGLSPHL